jgi:hypothetical protein
LEKGDGWEFRWVALWELDAKYPLFGMSENGTLDRLNTFSSRIVYNIARLWRLVHESKVPGYDHGSMRLDQRRGLASRYSPSPAPCLA